MLRLAVAAYSIKDLNHKIIPLNNNHFIMHQMYVFYKVTGQTDENNLASRSNKIYFVLAHLKMR